MIQLILEGKLEAGGLQGLAFKMHSAECFECRQHVNVNLMHSIFYF